MFSRDEANKEIELHKARLCTLDYAIVFQELFTLTHLYLKHEKTLSMHLHLTANMNLNKTIVIMKPDDK